MITKEILDLFGEDDEGKFCSDLWQNGPYRGMGHFFVVAPDYQVDPERSAFPCPPEKAVKDIFEKAETASIPLTELERKPYNAGVRGVEEECSDCDGGGEHACPAAGCGETHEGPTCNGRGVTSIKKGTPRYKGYVLYKYPAVDGIPEGKLLVEERVGRLLDGYLVMTTANQSVLPPDQRPAPADGESDWRYIVGRDPMTREIKIVAAHFLTTNPAEVS